MDKEQTSFYALGFSVAILENIRSSAAVAGKYEHFRELSQEYWNMFMEEFLFYDLHVCDRFVTHWYGAQERNGMMSGIISCIALLAEKGENTQMDEKLKALVGDDFSRYLKETYGVPMYDPLVDAYNQRMKEYAPLKFKKEGKQDNPADLLYQAFALKVSFLLGHPRNEVLKAHIVNFAVSVYSLIDSTKNILDKHWGGEEGKRPLK